MLANLLYAIALLLLSPLVLYRMLRFGRYRRGIREKFWGVSKKQALAITENKPCIWLHAVSVGEVNLITNLAGRLEQQYPQRRILVSCSTDTGYDLAVNKFGRDRVFFCPLDFSWAVRRTLRNLRPQLLVLAELELWPNLIRNAEKFACPVMVANARLSQRSSQGYQRFSTVTRGMFERLSWVGCQNEQAAERFVLCGTPKSQIEVTGSIKFDDAPTTRDCFEVQSRLQWTKANPWNRIWVVGSTQPGEEAMAIKTYQALRQSHPELRMILVPRHKERFDAVANLIQANGLNAQRRSIGEKASGQSDWNADTVILIDTIGELRHWWGVSHIATVGGSFGDRGGQNMLEPAGYGSAVCFGPDTRNFKEIAEQLIDSGGAVRVEGASALNDFVGRCLSDIPAADSLGRSAQQMIARHQGATNRTISALNWALSARTPRQIASTKKTFAA